MIAEIFDVPDDSSRFQEKALEIHDQLSTLIQKLEVLLYTRKGSVLAMPDFGIDLEKYIFETNLNADYIRNEIHMQMLKYVISKDDMRFNIRIDVEFYDRNPIFSFICMVDIYIDDKLVTTYAI